MCGLNRVLPHGVAMFPLKATDILKKKNLPGLIKGNFTSICWSEQSNARREAAQHGTSCSPALIRFWIFCSVSDFRMRDATLGVSIIVVLGNMTRIVGDRDNGAVLHTRSE